MSCQQVDNSDIFGKSHIDCGVDSDEHARRNGDHVTDAVRVSVPMPKPEFQSVANSQLGSGQTRMSALGFIPIRG